MIFTKSLCHVQVSLYVITQLSMLPHINSMLSTSMVIKKVSQKFHNFFLKTDISIPQGSVATNLRCGGIFNDHFITNLLPSVTGENF